MQIDSHMYIVLDVVQNTCIDSSKVNSKDRATLIIVNLMKHVSYKRDRHCNAYCLLPCILYTETAAPCNRLDRLNNISYMLLVTLLVRPFKIDISLGNIH